MRRVRKVIFTTPFKSLGALAEIEEAQRIEIKKRVKSGR